MKARIMSFGLVKVWHKEWSISWLPP